MDGGYCPFHRLYTTHVLCYVLLQNGILDLYGNPTKEFLNGLIICCVALSNYECDILFCLSK